MSYCQPSDWGNWKSGPCPCLGLALLTKVEIFYILAQVPGLRLLARKEKGYIYDLIFSESREKFNSFVIWMSWRRFCTNEKDDVVRFPRTYFQLSRVNNCLRRDKILILVRKFYFLFCQFSF